jgi:hypothetical protein
MRTEVRPRILTASLRTLSTLLLLTGSLAIQAGWQPYATAKVGGERYYLDPATIRSTPVGFTLVVLSNYPVPIKESFGTFQSVWSKIEMDCTHLQLRDMAIRFHRKPMAKGKVVLQDTGSGTFQSWPDGSLNEIVGPAKFKHRQTLN